MCTANSYCLAGYMNLNATLFSFTVAYRTLGKCNYLTMIAMISSSWILTSVIKVRFCVICSTDDLVPIIRLSKNIPFLYLLINSYLRKTFWKHIYILGHHSHVNHLSVSYKCSFKPMSNWTYDTILDTKNFCKKSLNHWTEYNIALYV